MARTRLLKPTFFTNEDLAELGPYAHILFGALWCLADKEGRLEDRPKRIKISALPFYEADVDQLLDALASKGFIERYEAEGLKVIQINNFVKHQNPHPREQSYGLPPKSKTSHVISTACHGNSKTSNADSGTSRAFPSSSLSPSSLSLEAVELSELVNSKADPIADGTCQDILTEMGAEQTKAKPDRAAIKQNSFRLRSLASGLDRWSRAEILVGWRWSLKSPDADAIWKPPGRGVDTFLKPEKIDGYIEAALTEQKSMSRPPPPEDDGPGSAAEVRRRREAFERKRREDEQRKRDGQSAGEWAASQATDASG